MNRTTDISGRVLLWALALFALAGLTGGLFRFVLAYGVSTGLDPTNIRHAHSHLMYFGWVTPALFVLVGRLVLRGVHSASPGIGQVHRAQSREIEPGNRGATPGAVAACALPKRVLNWTLLLALVTSAAFLGWGYAPTAIGPARIPVTIILSTACMIAWYFWIAWYLRARGGAAGLEARRLTDSAVVFLAVSTLGAWMVGALVPTGLATPVVKTVFAHLFLQYFAEGWFVLALLGVAWTRLDRAVRVPGWAFSMMMAGVAGGFLLSLPGTMIHSNTRMLAQLAGIAHGVGTVGLAWAWWRNAPAGDRATWGVPLLILAAKGATQAGAVLSPGVWWADAVSVRLLYLHVTLLGFVTLAIGAAMLRRSWLRIFQVTTLATIAGLVPLTSLWPWAPAGMWSLKLAAWLALGPPVVALAVLMAAKTEDSSVLLVGDRSRGSAGNEEADGTAVSHGQT